VENIIESVGHYSQNVTDYSIPCGQGTPTSPNVSSSYAGPHTLSRASDATLVNCSPRTPPRTPPRLRSIATQTGSGVEGDFCYLNRWLDRCRVSGACFARLVRMSSILHLATALLWLLGLFFILTGSDASTCVCVCRCTLLLLVSVFPSGSSNLTHV
jgi:hypothetical protein